MIFLQPFLYNFISHTHIIFLFSLFLFFSPLFLINEKREQQGCPKSCIKIVVQISLLLKLILHNQSLLKLPHIIAHSKLQLAIGQVSGRRWMDQQEKLGRCDQKKKKKRKCMQHLNQWFSLCLLYLEISIQTSQVA